LIDNTGLHKDHYTGALSELKAQQFYLSEGCQVYVPVVQQGWVDFVVDKDGLKKVQVKTATWVKSGKYSYLQCRTRLTHKYKDTQPKDRYDILLIIFEDRVWEIPAEEIDSSNLSLDTTNYNSNAGYRWTKYEH